MIIKKEGPLDKLDVVDLEYKGAKIHAYKREWQELNDKDKEVTKREYYCQLNRNDKWLNLGEMSDGSRFTAVAQAVNEAKWLVDYILEQGVDRKLLSIGFLREDLFKYNRLRINERLEVKEKLLLDNDLIKAKRLEKEERRIEEQEIKDLRLKKTFDTICLPAIKKNFLDKEDKILIIGRFIVIKIDDKVESHLTKYCICHSPVAQSGSERFFNTE